MAVVKEKRGRGIGVRYQTGKIVLLVFARLPGRPGVFLHDDRCAWASPSSPGWAAPLRGPRRASRAHALCRAGLSCLRWAAR